MRRLGCGERWLVREDGGPAFEHRINVTWVLDQGGPVLGYTHGRGRGKQILDRVRQLTKTSGLYGPGGVAAAMEHEAMDLLCDTVGSFLLPGRNKTAGRWFANGSDACDAAVRLARAYTDRLPVISIGYHGSSSLFSHPPQNLGIHPSQTADIYDIEFGDYNLLSRMSEARALAAIIVETPSVDDDVIPFLRACRAICATHGAMLIFDELVTGFRLGLGGAAQQYRIPPDMACYGKAMSNGRGISALVGPRDVMELLEEDVFYSNTFNGDPYNCAHVLATLEYLRTYDADVYSILTQVGTKLKNGLRNLGVPVLGQPVRSVIDDEWKHALEFKRAMVKEGILMDRPNYASTAHLGAPILETLNAAERVMEEL